MPARMACMPWSHACTHGTPGQWRLESPMTVGGLGNSHPSPNEHVTCTNNHVDTNEHACVMDEWESSVTVPHGENAAVVERHLPPWKVMAWRNMGILT